MIYLFFFSYIVYISFLQRSDYFSFSKLIIFYYYFNLIFRKRDEKCMRKCLCFVYLFVVVVFSTFIKNELRKKCCFFIQSVGQLAEMIDCSTKNSWMQYVGYGCYCGPGGQGPALDPVDRYVIWWLEIRVVIYILTKKLLS